MNKFLSSILLAASLFVGIVNSVDAQTAAQWNYSFVGNNAQATYPGQIAIPQLGTQNCLGTTGGLVGPGTCSGLTPLAADNVFGNPTGSTTTPQGMPLVSCSTDTSGLTYNTNTHVFNCNANAGTPSVISLSSCMNAQYGVGNWTKYTTQGTGTDIEPAIVSCLATIKTNYGRGAIWIDPGGIWAIKTGIPAASLSGNYILGAGSQASEVVYQSATGNAFAWSGDVGHTGGGIRGIGIFLDSGLGTTSANGIQLVGNSTYQADQWELDDVYMSAIAGSSYWHEGIQIDGSARTAPQGTRVGSINNLQIFNCAVAGFYGKNLVQWTITNVGTYTGQTTAGMDFYVTGAGPSLTNSTQVTLSGIVVGGTLYLQNNSNVGLINVKTNNLTTDATATYANGYINVGGTTTGTFGTGSFVTIN